MRPGVARRPARAPPLWRDCLRVDGATFGAFDAGGAAFSPDGRLLVVGVRGTVGKGAPSAVAVLDARRGTVVGKLAEGDYLRSAEAPEHQVTRVAFEDHTHLLLAVSDSTYGTGRRPFAALVRCELHLGDLPAGHRTEAVDTRAGASLRDRRLGRLREDEHTCMIRTYVRLLGRCSGCGRGVGRRARVV